MTKKKTEKKNKPAPTCGICRYFIATTAILGECRAEPPSIVNAAGKTAWPKIKNTEWCGCFKLAKK